MRPKITTEDVAPTINQSIDMSSSIATEDIDHPNVDIVTDIDPNGQYIRDLDFMEEVVTFIVGKGGKFDPNPIIAGCNGQNLVIERGKPVKAKRKFLNTLINTVFSLDTQEYLDDNGLKQTKVETTHTPSLSIQLLVDPSGQKGMEWFANVQHGTY